MKYLLLIFILLFSCTTTDPNTGKVITGTDKDLEFIETKTGYCYGGIPVYEIVIEGCQYIRFGAGSQGHFAHKGNCNNIIHCHNK